MPEHSSSKDVQASPNSASVFRHASRMTSMGVSGKCSWDTMLSSNLFLAKVAAQMPQWPSKTCEGETKEEKARSSFSSLAQTEDFKGTRPTCLDVDDDDDDVDERRRTSNPEAGRPREREGGGGGRGNAERTPALRSRSSPATIRGRMPPETGRGSVTYPIIRRR